MNEPRVTDYLRPARDAADAVERNRLLGEARRLLSEIEQIFLDVAHWNEHVRQPNEEPIDPDPDGVLGRMREGYKRLLAQEGA